MSVISQWASDPLGYLLNLLKLIPAILPALILHEVAHGYTAYRLGDPTAKRMGRLSLNPARHLDLWGTICMFVVGLGWAKPVPVDPRYFKRPRRDILLVSIAGVVTNFIMFVLGCAAMYCMIFAAMRAVPADMWLAEGLITERTLTTTYYIPTESFFLHLRSIGTLDYLITPYLGQFCSIVYEIILSFTVLNLSLALFNLLPVPPLDGYRVLNTFLPHGTPFTSRRIAQLCQFALMILAFTGVLGEGLSWLIDHVMNGIGSLMLLISGI